MSEASQPDIRDNYDLFSWNNARIGAASASRRQSPIQGGLEALARLGRLRQCRVCELLDEKRDLA